MLFRTRSIKPDDVRLAPADDLSLSHTGTPTPSSRPRRGDRLIDRLMVVLLFTAASLVLYDLYALLNGLS